MTDRIYRTTRGDEAPRLAARLRPVLLRGRRLRPAVRRSREGPRERVVDRGQPAGPESRRLRHERPGYLIITLDGVAAASLLNSGSQMNAIAWDPNDPNAVFVGLESQMELISGQGADTSSGASPAWTSRAEDRGPGRQRDRRPDHVCRRLLYLLRACRQPRDLALQLEPDVRRVRSTASSARPTTARTGASTATTSRRRGSRRSSSRRTAASSGAATWGRGMWEIAPCGGTPGPTSAPTPISPSPGEPAARAERGVLRRVVRAAPRRGAGPSATGPPPPSRTRRRSTRTPRRPTAVTLTAGKRRRPHVPRPGRFTVSYGSTGTGNAYTYLIPVVLTAPGRAGRSSRRS